jgi:hypothetical protein
MSEVLVEVLIILRASWLCSCGLMYQYQGKKIREVGSSEKLVPHYQTTRRHISIDRNILQQWLCVCDK